MSTSAISIKANMLVNFQMFERSSEQVNSLPVSNISTSAQLSKKSANRLKNVLNLLFHCSQKKTVMNFETKKTFTFRVNFITLTLSSKQINSDKEILKYCLEPFIRILRKKLSGLLYVWKAEVQDNENIHFHLNTSSYIDHSYLRSVWNNCQNKLGYIERCRLKNPNSTDVHAVRNQKMLGAYMAKYMLKGDLYKTPLKRYFRRFGKTLLAKNFSCNIPKNYFANLKRKLTCKKWDCSKALKNAKFTSYLNSFEEENDWNYLISKYKFIDTDYCRIFPSVNWNDKNFKIFNTYYREMIAEVVAIEKKNLTLIKINENEK